MTNRPDDGDALERELRTPATYAPAESGPAASASDCPSPEELAAWWDGGLAAGPRATLQAHVSTCPSCLEVVGLLGRSAPAVDVPARPWVRWFVPAAAALALLAGGWSLVRLLGPGTSGVALEGQQARLPEPTPEPGGPGLTGSALERVVPGPSPADARAQLGAPTDGEVHSTSPALSSAASAPPASPAAGGPASELAGPSRDAPPPPTSPAPASPPVEAPPNAVAAARPRAPGPLESRSDDLQSSARAGVGQPAPARREADAVFAPSVADVDPRSLSEAGALRPADRWRVTADGQLETSVDGGRRWERRAVPAVAREILDGVLLGDGAAWFVGRGGLVLWSGEGRQFDRRPGPAATDLVSVAARDAREATIRARDGRVWRTVDGARTWTPQPPGPQGN